MNRKDYLKDIKGNDLEGLFDWFCNLEDIWTANFQNTEVGSLDDESEQGRDDCQFLMDEIKKEYYKKLEEGNKNLTKVKRTTLEGQEGWVLNCWKAQEDSE